MRTWMSLLIVLLVAATAWAQGPLIDEFAEPQFGLYGIGSEEQLGGGFLLKGDDNLTAVGLDGRWIDDGRQTWAASATVMRTALPEIQVPIGGLLPQFDLPLPDSIPVRLNLGGRLGFQRSEEEAPTEKNPDLEQNHILLGAIVEIETAVGRQASWGVRYEWQGDSGFWGELADNPTEHATFLVLKYWH